MSNTERCALCGGDRDLSAYAVPPRGDAVPTCGVCRPQIEGAAPLDAKHWHCLRDAVWSEVPAVQVVAWRLLNRLEGEGWARDLLDQVYLDEAVLEWARAEPDAAAEAQVRTLDSHGAELLDGDSVTLVKDLDVKGAGFTAKRGTVVKNIRRTDDPGLVEGKVNGVAIYLKTEFLKKIR